MPWNWKQWNEQKQIYLQQEGMAWEKQQQKKLNERSKTSYNNNSSDQKHTHTQFHFFFERIFFLPNNH